MTMYLKVLAERVNEILKQWFYFIAAKRLKILKVLISESINTYNTLRSCLNLGMKILEEALKKRLLITAGLIKIIINAF
jgi:hypothetical protein